MNDLKYLKDIYEAHLLLGDASVIIDENRRKVNEIALKLYNKPKLNNEEIETLKYLLMICNVLYNRTDMEVPWINDEFYDMILEKYKNYDSNFQVGAAVCEFQSMVEKDPNYKQVIQPIYYIPPHEPDNPVSKELFNDIIDPKMHMLNQQTPFDYRDLHITPIYNTPGYINKRTHDTEHHHPSLVGTLDKCKFVMVQDAIDAGAINDPNVKILERDFFQKHINMGIINPNKEYEIVLELKYDGISVEADCTNVVESARTRGDTGIGVASDITPILEGYPFPHARCRIGQPPLGVKFEAIMTKTALSEFCKEREQNYINCRTAIIGLFGNSDAYRYRDYITLVPLAIDREEFPYLENREYEIKFLNEVFISHGEPLRYYIVKGTIPQLLFYTKKYLEEAAAAREYLNFMYDGIVVSYMDENIRAKLGRENSINKYSMAVKFNPMTKTTTFRGYTYEVGQNGNVTPMLHYDPVEFLGSIHTKCSGASLARFNELSLKYGDHIDVTYRNDVMPYVTKPDCEYNRNNPNPVIEPPTICPACGEPLSVSDSGKTLMCTNFNCPERKVGRTTNMLAKLNLKGFGEQMIRQIDRYNLVDLIDLDVSYLGPRIGEVNALNFISLMNKLQTEPIYDYQIVGALGFSGIATKTWKLIFEEINYTDLLQSLTDEIVPPNEYFNWMCNIKGIGMATVETIAREYHYFKDDLRLILRMNNVKSCKEIQSRKQIRFSGCRDLQLEEQLTKEGYDADSNSSVTKKTDILLVPYEGYTSTKTRKMTDYGKIIPIQQFKENMNYYLS